MHFRLIAALALLSMLLTLTACGGDDNADQDDEGTEVTSPGISVSDAWIRPAVLPQGSPTPDPDDDDARTGVISAMYMVIENTGSQSVQLVGIETDVARVVELHETRNENGLMRMRPVEQVDVPASGELAFQPGGYHVMLIDINRPLEAGDEVAVTLIFSTGERVELPDVPVQDS